MRGELTFPPQQSETVSCGCSRGPCVSATLRLACGYLAGLVCQKPDGIHLQAAGRIVDPHQKFLSLHQRVEPAIIEHP